MDPELQALIDAYKNAHAATTNAQQAQTQAAALIVTLDNQIAALQAQKLAAIDASQPTSDDDEIEAESSALSALVNYILTH